MWTQVGPAGTLGGMEPAPVTPLDRSRRARGGPTGALPDEAAGDPQGVKSAERSVRLLEMLAASEHRPTLAELHAASGIPKSSLHVLLRTLTRAGWVEQGAAGDGYGIGPRALICGTAYLDRDPALPLGIEAIEQLRTEVGYSSHYGRLDGSNVLYLATREATAPARLVSRVGRVLPAHLTALGLALLADRTEAEIDRVVPAVLTPLTPSSVVDRAQLSAAVARARADGFAVEREQNSTGICCVARSVGFRIPATDSISCSLPLALATGEEVARVSAALERTADGLAAALRRAGVR